MTWALLEGAGDNHSEVVLAHWTAFSQGTSQRPSNNHKDCGTNSTSLSRAISSDPREGVQLPSCFWMQQRTPELEEPPSTRVEGLSVFWCWDLTQMCVCTCPHAQAQEHSRTRTSHVCDCKYLHTPQCSGTLGKPVEGVVHGSAPQIWNSEKQTRQLSSWNPNPLEK